MRPSPYFSLTLLAVLIPGIANVSPLSMNLAVFFLRKRSLHGVGKCLSLVPLVALAIGLNAQTPSFSAQSPTAGLAGSNFEVILPLVNSGSAAAGSVQVTAVELSSAGIVSAALRSPTLPVQIGSFPIGAQYILDFAFDAQPLKKGSKYLLTVRGNYSSGGNTVSFAVESTSCLFRLKSFWRPG